MRYVAKVHVGKGNGKDSVSSEYAAGNERFAPYECDFVGFYIDVFVCLGVDFDCRVGCFAVAYQEGVALGISYYECFRRELFDFLRGGELQHSLFRIIAVDVLLFSLAACIAVVFYWCKGRGDFNGYSCDVLFRYVRGKLIAGEVRYRCDAWKGLCHRWTEVC